MRAARAVGNWLTALGALAGVSVVAASAAGAAATLTGADSRANTPTAENPATPSNVLAGAPSDLSVTVYRAPQRGSGSMDLNSLAGFALISETRTVHLPAGLSRLRFEGVVDGIEAASAIVTGLPDGVIEKNRDAALLSPTALIAAAVGKPLLLMRTNRKTGKQERVTGTLLSDAEGGVAFESAEGLEGLRCSGLPETFSFTGIGNASATATLSVVVRSAAAMTRTVTLSYLARGFDWAADYTATLSADGQHLDLGAWITLANGNGVGFPEAHTQVVAGRVNRESTELDPIELGGPILALCWPRGSTSDIAYLQVDASFRAFDSRRNPTMMESMMAAPAVAMTQTSRIAQRKVEQEQLGDLKLYRVPDRTTVAARQSKQVRLLDKASIPVTTLYGATLSEDNVSALPATRLLRTLNTPENHLGVPLPSGQVAVYANQAGEPLLQRESGMRDLAVGEEVEIELGVSADVRITSTKLPPQPTSPQMASPQPTPPPRVPGVPVFRPAKLSDVLSVEISNARPGAIQFELALSMPSGASVVRADHPVGTKNGHPIFRLTVPAQAVAVLHYQIQQPNFVPKR